MKKNGKKKLNRIPFFFMGVLGGCIGFGHTLCEKSIEESDSPGIEKSIESQAKILVEDPSKDVADLLMEAPPTLADGGYVVSVPKKISFVNLQANTEHEFSNSVYVKACNLVPEQRIDISVKNLVLKDRLSDEEGHAEKNMYAYFTKGLGTGNDEDGYHSQELAKAGAGTENLVITSGSGSATVTEPHFYKPASLYLKAPEEIHAGVWYGTLVYTVTSSR